MDSEAPIDTDQKRMTWTPPMDRYFIDLMLEQTAQGKKIDGQFTKQAWSQMTGQFNEKFGLCMDKDHMKNRIKTFKKQYITIKTLLNQSGFGWDTVRQMVTANDIVWDEYLRAHGNAKQYRTKSLPYYNDLAFLFRKDTADGRYSFTGQRVDLLDKSPVLEKSRASMLGAPFQPLSAVPGFLIEDTQQESSHSGGDINLSNSPSKRFSTTPPTPKIPKRRRKSTEGRERDFEAPIDTDPKKMNWNPLDTDPKRMNWNPPMDRYFVDLMLNQVAQGNRINGQFTKRAWTQMTNQFNVKFRLRMDKDHMKNRIKTFKKQYNTIKALLDENGFSWDNIQQMVKANDNIWDEYLKAHEKVKQYRTKSVPYYNDLVIVFGTDMAAGGQSFMGHGMDPLDKSHVLETNGTSALSEPSPSTSVAPDNLINDAQQVLSHSGGNVNISNSRSKDRPTTPSTSETSMKGHRSTPEGMVEALSSIAAALSRIADGLARKDRHKKKHSWIDALRELPDLERDFFLDACELLEDVRKREVFLELNVLERKDWLMRRLNR